MNTVSFGKIRKLAIKKIVFPALFGLVALAAQMVAPVAYLYAAGGTVTINAKVQDASVICVSMTFNGNTKDHPHIHNHPAAIHFTDIASPNDVGTMKTFKDHTCQGNPSNTIKIAIPNSSTPVSQCTIVLAAPKKIGKLACK